MWDSGITEAQRLLPVVVWRALPFLAYALVSSNVRWRVKWSCTGALVALGYFGVELHKIHLHSVAVAGLVLAYFAIVSLGVAAASRARVLQRLGSGLVFGCLLITCLVLPGLCAGTEQIPVLVGFEVLLGAFSYCVEHKDEGAKVRVTECLFFLLVNPALVYRESGTIDDRPRRILRASARVLLGLVAWALQDVVAAFAQAHSVDPEFPSIEYAVTKGYLSFVSVASVALISVWLAHSGLASIRIGLMTYAGYQIPENYHYPLLSSSPHEFWRRWNVWVGSWFRRYMFFPLTLRLGRVTGTVVPAAIGAVLATFVAVGLLHECMKMLTSGSVLSTRWPAPKGPILFGLFGGAFALWEGALSMSGAWRSSLGGHSTGTRRVLVRAAMVLMFMQTQFVVYGVAIYACQHWSLW